MVMLVVLLFVFASMAYGAGIWRGWALGRAHAERELAALLAQQQVLDLRDPPTIAASRADELTR